jgi:hypothetical protein
MAGFSSHSARSGFSAFAGGASTIDLRKKGFGGIGLVIAKAHTMLDRYRQPLVEKKRSDPGAAGKHRCAVSLAGSITLSWLLSHPLDAGG